MRRLLVLLFLLTGLLLLLPASACAKEINRLYVWDGAADAPDGGLAPGAIQWYKRGNTYFLFLPSGLDASRLRVHFTGTATQFTVNGVTVENDTVTDVFIPGETLKLTNGNNSYTVTVTQSANIASVYIRTASGSIAKISESKRNTESGSVYVLDEAASVTYRNDFDYIRVRGNDSFYPYKKSFHIKLLESSPMLGMPSAKTWLLIAGYYDNSMLRNPLTMDLAAAAGMRYTGEYRFADVYVNTVYYGAYILCEKVQVNKNRVAITNLEKATEIVNSADLSSYAKKGTRTYARSTVKYLDIPNDPEDITGGYLLQLELDERYGQAASGFVTDHGQAVVLKSPEFATKAQVKYISALVQSFENAIWAEDGVDPDTGLHYSEIADMDSLVGKYIIEELTKNMDANKTSFYLYKDSDGVSGKLFFGPVWDYDIAYGNYATMYYARTLEDPEGLLAATDDYRRYYWFPRLWQHEDFRRAVRDAWRERFRPLLGVLLGERTAGEDACGLMALDDYEALVSGAAALNFTRWRTFNSNKFPVRTGADFHENIEYLRAFLTARVAYLDSLWLKGEE